MIPRSYGPIFTSWDIARRRLKCQLDSLSVAGLRPLSPDVCLRLAPRNLVAFANKLNYQIFDDFQSPAFLLGWPDRMGHIEVGSRQPRGSLIGVQG